MDGLAHPPAAAPVRVADVAERLAHRRRRRPSPRAPRARRSARASRPPRGPPLGSPVTRLPGGRDHEHVVAAHARRRRRRSPRGSVDIALQRRRVVDRQPPAALGDHAGALEHGEEAARPTRARSRRACARSACVAVIEHVALARALGARLLDELGEHGGDAALHGLEGLAARAARWPRAAGGRARSTSLTAMLRVARASAARMSGPRIASTSRSSIASTVAERRSSSNIASSPKMSPGPNVRERDLAAVGVLAHRARVAGAHDVARVGVVALAEDDLARGEARAGRRPSATRPRSSRAELREHRHAAEQLGGVLGAGGHVAAGHTTAPRPSTPRSSARSRAPARRRAAGGEPRQRGEQRERQQRPRARSAATPAVTSSTRPASCSASPGRPAVVAAGAPPSPRSATSVDARLARSRARVLGAHAAALARR